jgi:hypothetical protein
MPRRPRLRRFAFLRAAAEARLSTPMEAFWKPPARVQTEVSIRSVGWFNPG